MSPILVAAILTWLYSHDLKFGILATQSAGEEVGPFQLWLYLGVTIICGVLSIWSFIDWVF